MNYEEYISGQTSAQVNPREAEWSNYLNQYGSPVKAEKTYAQNNAKTVKASSYMEMGPEVYVRPTHEAQLQQQIGKMQQHSIESRLVDQMREYNQSYINQMEALKERTAPKKAEPAKEKEVAENNKKPYVKPEMNVEPAPLNVKLFDDEDDEQDEADVLEKPVDLTNFKKYDSIDEIEPEVEKEPEYTITFKDGDEVLKTVTGVAGTDVSAPNVSKEGYDFNGWSVDGKSAILPVDEITDSDMTYIALWFELQQEEPEIPGISFTDTEEDDDVDTEVRPDFLDDEQFSLDPPELDFIEAPITEAPAGLQLNDVTTDADDAAANIAEEGPKVEKKKPGRKPGSTNKKTATATAKKDSAAKTSKKTADTKKKTASDKKKSPKK